MLFCWHTLTLWIEVLMMVMMSVQGPYRSYIGLINKSQKGEEEAEQHSFFYLEPAPLAFESSSEEKHGIS